jgi:hypothetical protein
VQAPSAAEIGTAVTEKRVARKDATAPAAEVQAAVADGIVPKKKVKARTRISERETTPPAATVTDAPAEIATKPTSAPETVPASPAVELVDAIKARMQLAGLSIPAAARQMDIAPVSLHNLLTKGSRANTRTRERLEAWLQREIQVPVPAKAKPKTKVRPEDHARPAPAEEKAPKTKAPAKEPKAKTPRQPRKPRLTSPRLLKALATIQDALASQREEPEAKVAPAHPMLKDALALKVHQAPKHIREGITALLGMAGF